MNRRDCPGFREDIPSFSVDGPQTFKVSPEPTSACWTTDPVPEGNVRAYADIPASAIFIPVGPESFIVDSCLVPECLNCPECCGSREMPDVTCGEGFNGPRKCCECGDNYALTIIERMERHEVGTHYGDPCTNYPALAYEQPVLDIVETHEATFNFGCVDGVRVVTGIGRINTLAQTHYADLRVHYPTTPTDSCYVESISRGRTQETTIEQAYQWGDRQPGLEGCGVTRQSIRQLTPSSDAPLSGYGLAKYDFEGVCFGSESRFSDGCLTENGGPNGVSCQFGIDPGSSVEWSGSQSCRGGSVRESGTFVLPLSNPVAMYINGGPAQEGLYLGARSGTWTYSIEWNVTRGDLCQQDPCSKQEPVGLTKTTLKGAKNTGSLAMRVGNGSVLDRALNAKAKDCNCGKR